MRLSALLRLAMIAVVALAPGAPTAARPRPATAVAAQPRQASLGQAMIAAANPLAVEAGLAVLRRGGSAVDAAVAIQAVLGLVEPQSSGLGGGAFMLFRDGRTGRMTVYDGRETAPKAAGPDWFLGADGKPLGFFTAVVSGRATGVPGAIAMLGLAQKEHGRLPWPSLFTDAAKLATDGFTVSPRLAGSIRLGFLPQPKQPDAVRYFTKPDGTKYGVGDTLKNPAYAASLRRIAAEGPRALLSGPLAADIVARVGEGEHTSGMTLADLAAYQPVKREALCRPYRVYVVCSAPPPAGGIGLLELMGVLEHTGVAAQGPSPAGWITFAQASRLMYADRDQFVGDPAFVRVPMEGLLAPDYLARRAALILTLGPGIPAHGQPAGAPVPATADATREPGGTTHLVIVDRWGDAVSMTTTVESVFGSGRMVDGFFLNNQLTDFSFSPTAPDGAPAANAVGPGKRPRSSMSPAMVLDRKGRLLMVIGSPGGNAIIAYVAKALVGALDWNLPLQQALDLPNVVARGGTISTEAGRLDEATLAALRATGAEVASNGGENSGLHAIRVRPDGTLEGAADSRREGVARSP